MFTPPQFVNTNFIVSPTVGSTTPVPDAIPPNGDKDFAVLSIIFYS